MSSPIRTLKRRGSFERAYRSGRRYRSGCFVCMVLDERLEGVAGDPLPLRVGYAISRKTGSAVRRNRLRRLLREGLRTLPLRREVPMALVFIARPLPALPPYGDLLTELRRVLNKCGLLPPPAQVAECSPSCS